MGSILHPSQALQYYHGIYGQAKFAMTFLMPNGYNRIDSVVLPLIRVNSMTGTAIVSIYATSGGWPTGGALTSATIDVGTIAGSKDFKTLTFTPLAVTPGVTYAIVLEAPVGGNSNTLVGWWHDVGAYGDGEGFLNNGSWSTYSGRDFGFDLWGSYVAPPAVTIPVLNPSGSVESSVTQTGFSFTGEVTSAGGGTISGRGMVYSSTQATPTIANATVAATVGTMGAFSVSTITTLVASTLYYTRAYATNEAGVGYGSIIQVTTLAPNAPEPDPTIPVVLNGGPSFITTHGYIFDAMVDSDGGSPITERGFIISDAQCPDETEDPYTGGTVVQVSGTTGIMSYDFDGYQPGYGQWILAYAINAVGITYGNGCIYVTTNEYEDVSLVDPDCASSCDCLPQTATNYEITTVKVLVTDTTITVVGVAPSCGFGMWIPCEPDKGEIFKIIEGVYDINTNTTTLTITRGLPYSNCDQTGDSSLVFDHPNTQRLVIGTAEIHYYYCELCQKLECIKDKMKCCMTDLAEIEALPNPQPGDRCVAWNSGEPTMYVYDCGDSGQGWKPICCERGEVDCSQIRPCISAIAPVVYDESSGVISLDANECHFETLNGELSSLVPQASVGHGGVTNASNIHLTTQTGYVFNDTIVNFPASGSCSPRLITLSWQLDTSVKVTGSGWGTSIAFGLDIYKRTNGGAWVELKHDYQERQFTNQAYGEGNQEWGDNHMSTITIFDIETTPTDAHDYCVVYRYFGYGLAQAYFSDFSWDWSYITLAK